MTAKDLKNALLQEAVQGKLVPQITSEGNARDLLEEIRKEKLSHGLDFANAKSGKKKPKKETALAGSNPCDIKEEEIPFEIPENWCWCRLNDLCVLIEDCPHSTAKDEGIGFPLIRTPNIGEGRLHFEGVHRVSKKVFDERNFRAIPKERDLIFAREAPAGNVAVIQKDEIVCLGQRTVLIRPLHEILNADFLAYYILSPSTQRNLVRKAAGTTVTHVNMADIRSFPIPLPPLAEQKRIVAAIEKFMPLIEEYGKKETQLKAINEKIGTLTKKAILQEAVQGKLVPQIAAEGNAKDLLEEIKKEKAKLIKEGKIKKEKPLPEITEDEIPFEIPETWCWCRLSEYIDIRDGTHDSPKFYDTGVPFVTSKNLDNGTLDFSSSKFISEEDHKKFSARSFVEDGDILFAMIGSIGNPVIVKKEFDFSFKNMALFKRYFKEKTNMQYIFYYLSYIQTELKKIATGGVQSFIGLGTFREMLFPLPPLAEQKRIVASIQKILPLCEKLGE